MRGGFRFAGTTVSKSPERRFPKRRTAGFRRAEYSRAENGVPAKATPLFEGAVIEADWGMRTLFTPSKDLCFQKNVVFRCYLNAVALITRRLNTTGRTPAALEFIGTSCQTANGKPNVPGQREPSQTNQSPLRIREGGFDYNQELYGQSAPCRVQAAAPFSSRLP